LDGEVFLIGNTTVYLLMNVSKWDVYLFSKFGRVKEIVNLRKAAFGIHKGYVTEKCEPPSPKPNPQVWRKVPVSDIPVRYGTVKLAPLPISASCIPRKAMGCGGEERGDDTWNRFQGNAEAK
jgi:hypothetical protein